MPPDNHFSLCHLIYYFSKKKIIILSIIISCLITIGLNYLIDDMIAAILLLNICIIPACQFILKQLKYYLDLFFPED